MIVLVSKWEINNCYFITFLHIKEEKKQLLVANFASDQNYYVKNTI